MSDLTKPKLPLPWFEPEPTKSHSQRGDEAILTRAKALCSAGRLAWYELDLPAARAYLEEGLGLLRQTGEPVGTLSAMGSLMMVLSWQGEFDQALALLREGMALQRDLPNRRALLTGLSSFGWAAMFLSAREALDDALSLNREVADLAREANDERGLAWAMDNLGQGAYWKGEWAQARRHLEESIPLFEQVGETWGTTHAVWALGNATRRLGRFAEARAFNDESMRLQIEHQAWTGAPYTLESYAYLDMAEDKPDRAACLLAGAERVRELHGGRRQPLVQAEYEAYLSTLRDSLSETQWAKARARGRAMTRDEAIEYAMHP